MSFCTSCTASNTFSFSSKEPLTMEDSKSGRLWTGIWPSICCSCTYNGGRERRGKERRERRGKEKGGEVEERRERRGEEGGEEGEERRGEERRERRGGRGEERRERRGGRGKEGEERRGGRGEKGEERRGRGEEKEERRGGREEDCHITGREVHCMWISTVKGLITYRCRY